MIPASTTKLSTISMSLWEEDSNGLPIKYSGTIDKQRTLNEIFFVIGSGDPSMEQVKQGVVLFSKSAILAS